MCVYILAKKKFIFCGHIDQNSNVVCLCGMYGHENKSDLPLIIMINRMIVDKHIVDDDDEGKLVAILYNNGLFFNY